MSAAAFIQAPKWRWPVALAAVIALHGAALLVLRDVRPVSAPDVPQDAVMLDLTPPAAPAPATEPAPPPPTPAPAPPPAVPETAMAPPPAAVPEKAEVVLPPPPPLPLPRAAPAPKRHLPLAKPRPTSPRPVAAVPAPAAPAAEAPRVSAPPAAVAPRPSPAAPGPEAATWASRLASHLLRFRHYPADAERRGFTGVVMMRFSVDAGGHVVSQNVVRSSGHDQLDEEAAAWLQRAQPLPVPPPDQVAPAQILVPLAFVLR